MLSRAYLCLWVILFLCFASDICAQNIRTISIETQVEKGSANKALSQVSIFIGTKGIRTDINGLGWMTVSKTATYSLKASYPGYVSVLDTLLPGDDTTITIVLKEIKLYQANKITVNADRNTVYGTATQQIKVITSKELDEHRGQTLGESLNGQLGITTIQTGSSISKPVLRGLHSQRLLISNAGIAQEGQQWGAEHAPEIDILSIGSIQILKGAAGVEYGPGAMGGMIKVEPPSMMDTTGLKGIISSNLMSNNRQGSLSGSLDGAISLYSGVLSLKVQGSIRKAGDMEAASYVLGNTAFTEKNAFISTSYTHNNGIIVKSRFSTFTSELGIFKGSHISNLSDLLLAIERGKPLKEYEFSYAIANPKQNIAHDLWANSMSIPLSENIYAEIIHGWQFNDRKEFDAHNVRIPKDSVNALNEALAIPAMKLQLVTQSLDIKFKIQQPIHHITSTFGCSFQDQHNVRSGKVLLIPDYTSVNIGSYLLANYIDKSMIYNIGIRYDKKNIHIPALNTPIRKIQDTSLYFDGFSGAAGALWQYDTNIQCTINFGTAWRAPQINELFSNDIHHGTAQFEIGDISLKKEQSFSMDINTIYSEPDFHAECSIYSMWFDNYIVMLPDKEFPTVTVRGTFPTFRYSQTKAIIYGLELMAEYHMNDWSKVTVQTTITKGDDKTNNSPLFQIPANRYQANIHVHKQDFLSVFHDAFAEFGCLFVSTQDRFAPNLDYANPPLGYQLYNISFGGTIHTGYDKYISCTMSANNIFNTDYRDYLSRYRYFSADQGFNLTFRCSYSFSLL